MKHVKNKIKFQWALYNLRSSLIIPEKSQWRAVKMWNNSLSYKKANTRQKGLSSWSKNHPLKLTIAYFCLKMKHLQGLDLRRHNSRAHLMLIIFPQMPNSSVPMENVVPSNYLETPESVEISVSQWFTFCGNIDLYTFHKVTQNCISSWMDLLEKMWQLWRHLLGIMCFHTKMFLGMFCPKNML